MALKTWLKCAMTVSGRSWSSIFASIESVDVAEHFVRIKPRHGKLDFLIRISHLDFRDVELLSDCEVARLKEKRLDRKLVVLADGAQFVERHGDGNVEGLRLNQLMLLEVFE